MVGVATDAARLGYQAAELVLVGMRESVRLQSAKAPGRPAPGTPTVPVRDPSQPVPTNLVGDVASIFAELLGRAGKAAGEFAQTLTDQSGHTRGGSAEVPELEIEGVAGKTTTLEFAVWNTGTSILRQIRMSATDLVGAGERTPVDAITFKPAMISHVGPGKSESVEVSIKIPATLPPGTYRGLIQAEPGDTCAVIALAVSEPPPRAAARRRATR
jgi:hypothetical protein